MAKIIASKYRFKILSAICNKPNTPSNISSITNIQKSHTSKIIRELVILKVITTRMPKARKGRIYRPTELGITINYEIIKLNESYVD